ncbi:unnamed protein product [Caenorhabditis sp. 36 PRJEB53466]|nr:unnamed protein product [Caenorhabditis sp. 36 PRJEB53466]
MTKKIKHGKNDGSERELSKKAKITVNEEDDNICQKCNRHTHKDDPEARQTRKNGGTTLMSKKKSHFRLLEDFDLIGCDNCAQWYHKVCSGLEQFQYNLFDKYYCPKCVPTVGNSVEFPQSAPHRKTWWSPEERKSPMQVGSKQWIQYFTSWESKVPPPSASELTVAQNGFEFKKVFEKAGGFEKWDRVYLIREKKGLDMKMPDFATFDLENVVEMMGGAYLVDTIDVYSQTTCSMKLDTFLEKFRNTEDRSLIYNFLSLEFSKNRRLCEVVQAPKFVQDVSLVDLVFGGDSNDPKVADEHRPRVEQFCLASMAGSYTDFHVDFGGSSVYYHIFSGQKIFYILPPSNENLEAFAAHETGGSASTWFGNKTNGRCRRVLVNRGETLLIPSGWIHAVLTPADSLVFGGNFLHLGNCAMQFRIFDLEARIQQTTQIDEKFYFPNFKLVHWLLMSKILIPAIVEANGYEEDIRERSAHLWKSAKLTASYLKAWAAETQNNHDGIGAAKKREILAKYDEQHAVQTRIQKQKNRKS